ncbi:MAG TPA: glycoside hydrolase family 3 N-terminal domain-containing protein [Mucilaginibacter sp.]|jgi:beta-glucosidase|nr:glycoside hydrolase family 3 N-terminal domain-containing protein [Mucilaginibacter sp.]
MQRFKPLFFIAALLAISNITLAQQLTTAQKVDALMKKMTLAEKIGQLNQVNGDWEATGPITADVGNKLEQIKHGEIGSVLNIVGVSHTRAFQDAAMQSRLKIPLLFGQDVIHGYSITFPIPLAEAASWDIPAIGLSARVAATEAAAGGVHWTFAPMVDIARDPRWGRVMEGAGEDPYLGAQIARARVKGFQGNGLGNLDAIMACAKHYAAYGAAIGGRDYNSVDMSLHTLWEIYLPPFKAAEEAGAATFMNSFNSLNGTPATASSYLQRDILKGKWGFKGFVVSDWNSIGEMVPHGYAKDNYQAAEFAIKAGNDMDMESRSYVNNLAKLVAYKKVSVTMIDDAVRRILTKKFEMGLFDDPYRYSNAEREKSVLNKPEHVAAARDVARKSIVLLKNQGQVLPLSKNLNSIALIGPLVKSKAEMKGFWALDVGDVSQIVSLYEGMQEAAGNTKLLYAKGCDITDTSRAGFDEAYKTAMQADVVIMAMGERPDMTGEAKSRANIHIPGVQEELIQKIMSTGKPVVVLLMAGRPMVFNWTADHVPAILYTWWLGNQAGNAIADVLYGNYNPGAKLPITFPRTEGQIPVYYNHYNTGRPPQNDNDVNYTSAYNDLPNSPKFAFGYGLSYTTFAYSKLKLNKKTIHDNETITVSFDLTNTGKYAGEEVTQLYLRQLVSQPVRPVKELKGFEKVMLQPGETKTITFTINKEKLSFYNDQLVWGTQPGEFKLMIGSASDDIRLQDGFELL